MKKIYSVIFIGILILTTSASEASGQRTTPVAVTAVQKVDLKRYAGKWLEIGRYQNRFQKQCVGNTTANYTIKANGKIEVRNECLRKDGRTEVAIGEAKIADKATNAKLKVRFAPGALSFLPFVWGNYWIIDLDPNYGWVAVGEPKREYFWILSRTSKLDDATYQSILRRAESMGFNPAKVMRSPQDAEILKGTVIVKQ